MTTIAIGKRSQLSPQVMKSMHEFRYEVFVRRLGWALQSFSPAPAMEHDRYDTEDAVYLVASDEQQRVTACARLLNSVRPYMLPDLFPQLLGRAAPPRDPAVWELSRFATNVRETRAGRVLGLSEQTLELLDSIVGCAQQRAVQRLILVTSIAIERLILRANIDSHRIGPPLPIDGALCVALFIEVPQPYHRVTDCGAQASIPASHASCCPQAWNTSSSYIRLSQSPVAGASE